ncbi:glycolipid transfer protein 1 isoform X1 [Arachis hypogaea]|nr:glycolipid transfer protein 1 isoform X1 [Arachis hypogaea]
MHEIFIQSTNMEGTVFAPALEQLEHVKSEQGEILTKPFLDACKHILPVIDKFGTAMGLVKSDIGGNISRLETQYSSNPSRFNCLFSLVQAEVETNTTKASSSCTNGLLWLTRAMDFLVGLFQSLIEHEDWSLSQACTESYNNTLKKWHGWLASSSFGVVMKLVPDRKKFMEVLGGGGNLNADMEKFCATLSPLLEENHKFLARLGLDDMKAS